MKALKWAIGMMSGTSMDGIAVAAIKTDGEEIFEKKSGLTVSYSSEFRDKLRGILGQGTLTTPLKKSLPNFMPMLSFAIWKKLVSCPQQ